MYKGKFNFKKNVSLIFLGNLFNQILGVIVYFNLIKNLSADEVGNYVIFLSWVTILSTMVTLKFEMGIILPSEDYYAIQLFFLAKITSVFFIFLYFLSGLFFDFTYDFKTFVFIGITTVVTAFYNINTQILSRFEKFNVVGLSKILNITLQFLFQVCILFFLKKNSYYYLIINSYLISNIIVIIFQYVVIFNHRRYFLFKINIIQLKETIIKFKQIPLNLFPSNVFNILANQLPPILIGEVFSKTLVASFAIVQKVLNMPISLLSSAISQVYFKYIASYLEKEHAKEFVLKVSVFLFLLILPLTIALFFIPLDYIVIYLGKEYSPVKFILRVLILFYMVRFVFVGQISMLLVRNKSSQELIFNFLYFLGALIPIMLVYFFQIQWANYLYTYSLLGMLSFGYLGYLIYKWA